MKIQRITPEEARKLTNFLSMIESLKENNALYRAKDVLNDFAENEDREPLMKVKSGEFYQALYADEDEFVLPELNEFCRQALKQILEVFEEVSPLTALNLEVLLDPANEIVDETKSYLAFHPRFAGMKKDKERLDWIEKTFSDNKMFAIGKKSTGTYRQAIDNAMKSSSIPRGAR